MTLSRAQAEWPYYDTEMFCPEKWVIVRATEGLVAIPVLSDQLVVAISCRTSARMMMWQLLGGNP